MNQFSRTQLKYQSIFGADKIIETILLQKPIQADETIQDIIPNQPKVWILALQKMLSVPQNVVLDLIGMHPSRLSRSKINRFEMIERAAEVIKVFSRLEDSLGTQKAQQWLSTPHLLLENQTPLYLMRSIAGLNKVTDLIAALEDGVFL
jgi:putative toxin-antitoxin system antitoxin component (TIGR02293 family)